MTPATAVKEAIQGIVSPPLLTDLGRGFPACVFEHVLVFRHAP